MGSVCLCLGRGLQRTGATRSSFIPVLLAQSRGVSYKGDGPALIAAAPSCAPGGCGGAVVLLTRSRGLTCATRSGSWPLGIALRRCPSIIQRQQRDAAGEQARPAAPGGRPHGERRGAGTGGSRAAPSPAAPTRPPPPGVPHPAGPRQPHGPHRGLHQRQGALRQNRRGLQHLAHRGEVVWGVCVGGWCWHRRCPQPW